jgi:predicted O-methyltransferase YrrM
MVTAARVRVELRYMTSLRGLPPRVALFMVRARVDALRRRDDFSVLSATRPANLAVLLTLARGRRRVAELGTGSGWTSLALALADPQRRVVSFDPLYRPERERYARLVPASVRARVTFIEAPGVGGPADDESVDLLYVDSSHDRQDTIDELRAWRAALPAGARVVFDDYDNPHYPGVREAVAEMRLAGEQHGSLFVHDVPSG